MAEHTPIIIKKKKGHGEHGHHGGSWKVAYADFVTAMMAFFMVMWIMGLSDDTRAQIQGYFNDPLGFVKNEPKSRVNITPKGNPGGTGNTKGEGSTPIEEEKKQAKKIEGEIKEGLEGDTDLAALLQNVEMIVTPEGLRIEFLEGTNVGFFQSGKAVMTLDAKRFVARIAPILAKSGRRIVVEGHTDAAPYPSATYTNYELSADRASALRLELQLNGIPIKQFGGVRALADTQLRNRENPYDVSNRRVSLLLPFGAAASNTQLPKDEFERKIRNQVVPPVEVAPERPSIP